MALRLRERIGRSRLSRPSPQWSLDPMVLRICAVVIARDGLLTSDVPVGRCFCGAGACSGVYLSEDIPTA